jgi:two-component system, cell cycle response regulator DivK
MPRTILLVEDEGAASHIYTQALEAAGFNVIAANNGAEAVHLARRHRPDMILMKLRMPVMDGWHAIRYVRSDPRTSAIAVWGMSDGADQDQPGQPPSGRSFDRVMSKPITAETLVFELQRWFGDDRNLKSEPPAGAIQF